MIQDEQRDSEGCVLITGAGGFVGSAVARRMVRCASSASLRFEDSTPVELVVGLVRPNSDITRLIEILESPHFQIAYGNLDDIDSIDKLLDQFRPRAIIHTAVSPALHQPLSEHERANLIDEPLKAFCRTLKQRLNGHLITTGTSAILAPSLEIDENAPYESHPGYFKYAEHKTYEEKLLASITADSGVGWTHLRLFYLFGKYEASHRLIPSIVDNVLAEIPAPFGSGALIRDFSDVDDVADVYRCALMRRPPTVDGAIYNIGSGTPMSIGKLAQTVAAAVGDSRWLRTNAIDTNDAKQPRPYVCKPDKAVNTLGWRPTADVVTAIQHAARWRRNTVLKSMISSHKD